MGILIGCKKSDTPKDYAASIKDRTWWGIFTNTGKTPEYYSIHFNTDSSLLWSDLSGDYAGKWKIADRQLTMTFTAINDEIKADITDDDKLENITDNTSFYDVNSGALIASPNIPLDNTVWNGSANITTSKALQLRFNTGSKVTINIENTVIKSYSYTRSTSGAVIRTTLTGGDVFFGVITINNELRGSVGKSDSPWQANKQ